MAIPAVLTKLPWGGILKWLAIFAFIAALAYVGERGITKFFENQEQARIDYGVVVQESTVAKIESSSAEQQIESLTTQIELERAARDRLDTQLAASRKRLSDLQEVLSTHDTKTLMSRRPVQVISRINAGTNDVWKEAEELNAQMIGGAE